ncbi:MAG: hypothetical protein JWP92_640 [Caulobacter sp.]|nr:hypothetical protein [Caulobacter sp.]
MTTHKLAYLAAAATLAFAGAALAQTPPSPGSAQQTQTTPGAATTPDPSAAVGSGAPGTGKAAGAPSSGAATTTPPADASSASGAGTPSSATVAGEVPIGAQVKDPAGNLLGSIDSTTTGADGSTNVVVSSGGKKFALPKASLTVSGGAVSTTATKAQIDAALAATPK